MSDEKDAIADLVDLRTLMNSFVRSSVSDILVYCPVSGDDCFLVVQCWDAFASNLRQNINLKKTLVPESHFLK